MILKPQAITLSKTPAILLLLALAGCGGNGTPDDGGSGRNAGGSWGQLEPAHLQFGTTKWWEETDRYGLDLKAIGATRKSADELVTILPGTMPARCSPDGRLVALPVFAYSGSLWLFDLSGRKPVLKDGAITKGRNDPIGALAFSPDSKTLAVGYDNETLRLFDVSGGTLKPKVTLEWYQGAVKGLAFSPDGKTLAQIGGSAGAVVRKPKIRLWDLTTDPPTERVTFELKPDATLTVADCTVDFSQDGKTLIARHEAGTFFNEVSQSQDWFGYHLWDISGDKPRPDERLKSLPGPVIGLSGDLRTAAVAGENRTIVLYDRDGEKWTPRPPLIGHKGKGPWRVIFSPDGKTIISEEKGSDRFLVWSEKGTIAWDKSRFSDPVLSPDGNHVLAKGYQGPVPLVHVLRVPR